MPDQDDDAAGAKEGRAADDVLDVNTEIVIGNLLRAGVIFSAVIVAFGGVLYLLKFGATHRNLDVFIGEPHGLRDVRGIVKSAFSFDRRGIIQAGLVALIATPIARVIFSVYAFARQRDYLYVGVTLIVLTLLCFSLFGSR
jgi:uncharacterized membrane protein